MLRRKSPTLQFLTTIDFRVNALGFSVPPIVACNSPERRSLKPSHPDRHLHPHKYWRSLGVTEYIITIYIYTHTPLYLYSVLININI